jgi:hypothetical protein
MASAGEAGGDLASQVAGVAGERLGDAAVGAGRTAVEIGVQLRSLPQLVRHGARRGVELVEEAGSRVVAGVLHTGSRVLDAAADYVSEMTPRRPANRAALTSLLEDQLACALAGIDAYDRAAGEVGDDRMRVQAVRHKLQMIRQVETLRLLVGRVGSAVPEDLSPAASHAGANGDRGGEPGERRRTVARALGIAVESAAGWRALARVAVLAGSDRISDALTEAVEMVGESPDAQERFFRGALVETTVDAVLR